MAELEIHHEAESGGDPMGRRVGIMAAIVAVLLAVVTIASHRTHTAAILHKSRANDAWAYYQATRVKYHSVEMGDNMVRMFGGNGDAAKKMLDDDAVQKAKYEKQSGEIQKQAQEADDSAEAAEKHALRYDIGEGLLEIGLVLSSMYFIARKNIFPLIGAVAGAAGVLIAATGLVM
jgi:hypothetical protein